MLKLSEADHALVTAAVTEAERSSDGEIVTIVTAQSDSYRDVALHYSVLAMLLVPALVAILPQGWIDWISAASLGWNASIGRGALMAFLTALLAAAFLLVRLCLAHRQLAIALTPGSAKTRRVQRRAIEMFRASAEKRTGGRVGVLLYLSLLEHRAEIVADKAINDQVDGEVWGEAMAVLVENLKAGRPGEGMAKAVEQIGLVLARCLPKTSADTNELPDRLIEL